jgi:hypothetical protein
MAVEQAIGRLSLKRLHRTRAAGMTRPFCSLAVPLSELGLSYAAIGESRSRERCKCAMSEVSMAKTKSIRVNW